MQTIKTLLGHQLLAKKRDEVLRLSGVLHNHYSREDIEQYQVNRFNVVWKDAISHVPFYAKWQHDFKLPEQISSLDELTRWPILSKEDLRHLDAFKRDDCDVPSGEIKTGGSTGEPVHLPSWTDRGDGDSGVNQWVGRAAYGIHPGLKTFLLWGHQHLYGKGFKRFINTKVRAVKDYLSNYVRVSAYDLSQNAMLKAMRIFEQARPQVVIGFSPAVLAFCRINSEKGGKFHYVKAVLCTAGPLTPEEKRDIETFFSAKVCMEYGSVEGGIMAYTRPSDDHYVTFWNSHLIQAVKDVSGEYRNIVTRLTDHYVPLIRYDIGDYLDLEGSESEENKVSVLCAKTIKGRPSEIVHFDCGVSFFGALIGDCVKQVRSVISSQIAIDEKNNKLQIRVTTSRPLSEQDVALIKNRFSLTVENASKIDLSVVNPDKLYVTVGGKIPRIVRL